MSDKIRQIFEAVFLMQQGGKMKKNLKIFFIITAAVLVVCAAAAGGYLAGKYIERRDLREERERLYGLNRSALENMTVGDGPVYVVGHTSPDSDTVCSAVICARFLTMLGYQAEARIAEPVNRETQYILQKADIDVPQVLEDAAGKYIFLVDHSEYVQAVKGMEDAHIVGILDHHGIGTVTTGYQVYYEAKPIGSCSTMLWLDYLNYGFEIDQPTACLMLGAILSDTDNLTGSTVTEADRQAVRELAALTGTADIDAFYQTIHQEKLSYSGMTDLEILFSDYKEYEAGGMKFGIGLVGAIDEEAAAELAGRMDQALSSAIEDRDVDLMFAVVNIRENDEKIDYIIPATDYAEQIFTAAFPEYDEYDGTSYIFRSGLGRKTKIVPGLTDYLTKHPRE